MELRTTEARERGRQCIRLVMGGGVWLAAGIGLAASPPLTLPEVLEAVSTHSEAADQAVFDRQIAAERVDQAKALYLPVLDFSGGRVVRDHPVVAEFGQLQAPTTDTSYWTYQLGITEMLWDGGRRAAVVKNAEQQRHAQTERSAASVFDAQIAGAGTYLKAVALTGRREVVQERLKSLDDHLRVVRDMYEQGLVARNDLLETEVRRRVVEDQGASLDDAIAVTEADLSRQMGRAPDEEATVPQGLPAPPALPGTLDELVAEAVRSNRGLKALEATVAALQAQVEARRRAYWPTFTAALSHQYQQNHYLLYDNANVFQLGLSWDLFDGGTRKAELRQAELELARTRRQLTEAQRQVQVGVEQAYRAYEQALREAKTAVTNVRAAEENLRIVEDQYRAGLARTTDVLDAESTLAESHYQLVNQHVGAYLQQVTLLATVGRDLATFYRASVSGAQEPVR